MSFKTQLDSDRRTNPRTVVRFPTQVNTNFCSPIEAGTVDISRGGALLDSPAHLNVGHDVRLYFEIDSITMIAEARVKRANPVFWNLRHLVAVEFHEPMDELAMLAGQRSG